MLLSPRKGGHRIFAETFTQQVALANLRRYLTLRGEAESDRFTWKSIRRGRTTQLSCDQVNEEEIVRLGDWKKGSSSHKAYIDEDAVDRADHAGDSSSASEDDEDDEDSTN